MSNEEDDVTTLLILFRWDDEPFARYEALRILRSARGEVQPTWDDYVAGVQR